MSEFEAQQIRIFPTSMLQDGMMSTFVSTTCVPIHLCDLCKYLLCTFLDCLNESVLITGGGISSDSLHQGARCHPQPDQLIRWEMGVMATHLATSDLDGDCYCRQSLNTEHTLIAADWLLMIKWCRSDIAIHNLRVDKCKPDGKLQVNFTSI